jgi:WD40 repeat protein
MTVRSKIRRQFGSKALAGGLTGDTAVYVWDLATRKHRLLSRHGSGVVSGAWRADGRLLITAGSLDGTVRLWDLRGDRPRSRVLPVIPPSVPWLHGIALSPEGRHLAVCHSNGTVYVLRLAKRGEVFEVADGVKESKDEAKRPVRLCRQATPPPARQRPGAQSARPGPGNILLLGLEVG